MYPAYPPINTDTVYPTYAASSIASTATIINQIETETSIDRPGPSGLGIRARPASGQQRVNDDDGDEQLFDECRRLLAAGHRDHLRRAFADIWRRCSRKRRAPAVVELLSSSDEEGEEGDGDDEDEDEVLIVKHVRRSHGDDDETTTGPAE